MTTMSVADMLRRLVNPADGAPPGCCSDMDLLAAYVKDKRQEGFAALMRRYGGMVLQTCRRILGDGPDAEDAFQATFIILARKAKQLLASSSKLAMAGWLHRVAYRAALDVRIRNVRRRNNEQRAKAMSSTSHDPAIDVGWNEVRPILDTELNALPEQARRLLITCYLEGKTHAQAAKDLRLPLGSIAGRLERARKQLARRLAKRGIVVSVAGFAALLTEQAKGGNLPGVLQLQTLTAVAGFAIHGIAALPPRVAGIVNGVTRAMMHSWSKPALVLVCAIALAGAGVILCQSPDPRPSGPQASSSASGTSSKEQGTREDQDRPRLDGHGDLLPAEARLRIGTSRFIPSEPARDLAYSPDGKMLASVDAQGSIHVWNSESGKLIHIFGKAAAEWAKIRVDGQDYEPSLCAVHVYFSPDSKLVGAVQADHLRLFDVATGKESRTLFDTSSELFSFVFSPDGKSIVPITLKGKHITICDAVTGKVRSTLKGHDRPVKAVAFSSDGKWLVSGSDDHTIRIWDLETGKEKRAIEGHQSSVEAVALSADDKVLASVSSDMTARIWDPMTGDEVRTIKVPGRLAGGGDWGPHATLSLSPGGTTLAVAVRCWPLRVYEVATGKELERIGEDLQSLFWILPRAAFRPDGKVMAYRNGRDGMEIGFLDTATGAPLSRLEGQLGAIESVAISPDMRTLVTGGAEGTMRLSDLAGGKELRAMHEHIGNVDFIAFTPDGKRLISASYDYIDCALTIWDATTWKKERRIRAPDDRWGRDTFTNVVISPDGEKLGTYHGGRDVRVWEISDGKEHAQVDLKNGPGGSFTGAFAFTADSKTIIVPGQGGCLFLFDAKTGKEVRQLTKEPFAGLCTVSHDGKQGIAFKKDGEVVVLDMEKGEVACGMDARVKRLTRLRMDGTYRPLPVVFSRDGKMIATVDGQSVLLVDVGTGKVCREFKGHQAMVTSLAFMPDGKELVSASSDGTVLVWEMGEGKK